ncbi:Sorbitol dehydrogenase, partial [Operophtera brumata]
EKWPVPEINDYEVLIEVSCVGICGSDVKLYSTGKCGADLLTEPIVIGHEGAGTVVKTGPLQPVRPAALLLVHGRAGQPVPVLQACRRLLPQPLAIAIHACNRAAIKIGAKIAILGAGPIGILCAMSARAMGAGKILITDVVESRLSTARDLGADCTLLTHRDDSDGAIVTKTGGTVLVVGIGEDRVEVPLSPTLLREVDVRGSFRIVN